jgi:hypothetical protein
VLLLLAFGRYGRLRKNNLLRESGFLLWNHDDDTKSLHSIDPRSLPSGWRAMSTGWRRDLEFKPCSDDWNAAANWSPAIVPNGPAAAANFDFSIQTSPISPTVPPSRSGRTVTKPNTTAATGVILPSRWYPKAILPSLPPCKNGRRSCPVVDRISRKTRRGD